MENRPEKLLFPLAILLSFLLISGSVSARYDELKEIDFLSSHPIFENADLEVLEADKQNRTKAFAQGACSRNLFFQFFHC